MANYLQQGSTGDEVRKLQEMLKQAGYDPGGVDAIYGPNTAKAVRDFQKAQGLQVDALAGPQTLGALQSALTPKASPTVPTQMSTLAGGGTVAPTQAPTTPDYGAQIAQGLKALQDSISRTQVSPKDIVKSPEYKAQKELLDLNLGEQMAGLRRDFSSRNMLKGTPAVQTLAQTGLEGEVRAGALIPAMMQQVQSQRQQGVSNVLSQLGQIVNLYRGEQDASMAKKRLEQDIMNANRNFSLNEAGLTGTYQGRPTLQAMPKPAPAPTSKEAFVESAYRKLIEGQPLSDEEKSILGIGGAKDVTDAAIAYAQKDPAWQYLDPDDTVGRNRIVDYYKQLLGGSQSPAPAPMTVSEPQANAQGKVDGLRSQGFSDEQILQSIQEQRSILEAQGVDVDALIAYITGR